MVAQKGDRSRFEGAKKREGGVRIMLSPFRGFYDVQSEVDRLFNEMLGGLGRGRGREGGQQLGQWAPAVDVLTKDGDLVIRACEDAGYGTVRVRAFSKLHPKVRAHEGRGSR